MSVKTVFIDYDIEPECPMEWDGQWTLHSFSRRSTHKTDPDILQKKAIPHKLEVGLAFLLSYYEHGKGIYSLQGEGMQCQWDTAQDAGILVWEHDAREMGAKTYEDRQKDARTFLTTYNAWANGEVFCYSIEGGDSCGGFYEADCMSEEIALNFKEGDKIRLKGACAGVFDARKLPSGVEVV